MPKGQRSPDPQARPARSPLRSDELTIGASGAEVRRALEWLAATCRDRDVPRPLADRLALCLHESLANVVTHGGGSARAAPIAVVLEVTPAGQGIQAGVTV